LFDIFSKFGKVYIVVFYKYLNKKLKTEISFDGGKLNA